MTIKAQTGEGSGHYHVSTTTSPNPWLQQPTVYPANAYSYGYPVPVKTDGYANHVVIDYHTHDVTLRFRRQNGKQLTDVATITVPRSLFEQLQKEKKSSERNR